MELRRCLICMGSNTMPEKNLEVARKLLKELYPNIVFGSPIVSEPLFFSNNPHVFHNQLAFFDSELTEEKLQFHCKKIEVAVGRVSEEKLQEVVKLDIDLLMIGHTILRPEEINRKYIRKGMEELAFRLTK